MAKSILQEEKHCRICGSVRDLEEHHVFGAANRKRSDRDGLTIWLCADHHRGARGIHFNRKTDLYYKRQAELIWIRHYGKTVKDFIAEYGKNYLWD